MQVFRAGVKVFSFAVASSFVLYIARFVYLQYEYEMDDEFAQWGAADMVTLYMDNHNGEWPRSWDDLREFYDDGRSRIGGWSFEKYQSRVFIDFAVTAKELQELSFRPGPVGFNVIHARLTYTVYNPNETIRQYFQEKKQAHAEQPSVEATD